MAASLSSPSRYDDPRKLRDLVQKASELADRHQLSSVMVGMSAAEGDRLFPEIVDFVGSALRMDDAIFRMTRERAVCMLTDADRARAEAIMRRLMIDFSERFTPASEPEVDLAFFEVGPGHAGLCVRDVLPQLFGGDASTH